MKPEERAAKLFKRIIRPATGEFVTRHPTVEEITAAIRDAEAEARDALCAEIDRLKRVAAGWEKEETLL